MIERKVYKWWEHIIIWIGVFLYAGYVLGLMCTRYPNV